jgi:hypothetical protein
MYSTVNTAQPKNVLHSLPCSPLFDSQRGGYWLLAICHWLLAPGYQLPSAFLTTYHYLLITAFTPPPVFLPHPPTPRPPPPCFSVPRFLVPLVPRSLFFTHPPILRGPHPPMPFCETVKL